MTEISNVAVIGLGSMGWGVAMALIEAGYSVCGVDLNPDILARFAENQGIPCTTSAIAAKQSEAIMVFVVSEQQADLALFGDNGAVSAAAPETLFIINSTLASNAIVRIAKQLQAAGMRVVDAPVNGGPDRALRGELIVMVSGEKHDTELAAPVLDAISARVMDLGDQIGRASQLKMINQLLAGIHIAATAEVMTFASKLGVDLSMLYQVTVGSTGSSWMFEDRGQHIVSGNHKLRSSVDIILKDLEIASADASAHDVDLPLSAVAMALFSEAHSAGLGEEDGAAIVKILAAKYDTDMPGV